MRTPEFNEIQEARLNDLEEAKLAVEALLSKFSEIRSRLFLLNTTWETKEKIVEAIRGADFNFLTGLDDIDDQLDFLSSGRVDFMLKFNIFSRIRARFGITDEDIDVSRYVPEGSNKVEVAMIVLKIMTEETENYLKFIAKKEQAYEFFFKRMSLIMRLEREIRCDTFDELLRENFNNRVLSEYLDENIINRFKEMIGYNKGR